MCVCAPPELFPEIYFFRKFADGGNPAILSGEKNCLKTQLAENEMDSWGRATYSHTNRARGDDNDDDDDEKEDFSTDL